MLAVRKGDGRGVSVRAMSVVLSRNAPEFVLNNHRACPVVR